MAEAEQVESYRFTPDDLHADARTPGISAFMRIRNGADFLEATIRSHIDHFDEIVAVYNQCADATPEILARLAQEYGPKVRVFHYLPRVFPPGSEGHAREPADSPRSLVNYYNFALARTRHRIATKLDDDHLAMEPALADLTRRIRAGSFNDNEMACFSGLNLARDAAGKVGIHAREPFSGRGDIGFFAVSPETYFVRDQHFERFRRGALVRRFAGIVYWHLKYLKPDFGFGNYDLAANPNSRYARKLAYLRKHRAILGVVEFCARPEKLAQWPRWLLPEKAQLVRDRRNALRDGPFTEEEFATALAAIGADSTATAH